MNEDQPHIDAQVMAAVVADLKAGAALLRRAHARLVEALLDTAENASGAECEAARAQAEAILQRLGSK
jgi:hypothetical protein